MKWWRVNNVAIVMVLAVVGMVEILVVLLVCWWIWWWWVWRWTLDRMGFMVGPVGVST